MVEPLDQNLDIISELHGFERHSTSLGQFG
jgi:hypothetical protein